MRGEGRAVGAHRRGRRHRRGGDSIEEERIAEFFDAYAAALREFDAGRHGGAWGLPGMIVTDDFAGALESRADMAAGLASSYPLYRMLGLESASARSAP